MSWLRLEARFPTHPKVVGISDAAFRLHVCAMGYCREHETDGRVLVAVSESLTRHNAKTRLMAITQLVDVGLWEPVLGGWQIHDFLDWNPSKADLDKQRKASQERMQRGRSPSVRANNDQTSDEHRTKFKRSRADGAGSGSGLGSDPDPEGVQGEEPDEFTGVRHISSRPPPPPEPSEAAAPGFGSPPNRSEDAAPGNLGRPGAVASGDLAAYIRGKPKLSDLDVADLADFAGRMHDPGNVPIGMIREAIDDANDKSERGEARHIRHARVIGFIKRAKTKPRKPDPKPPALVDDDDMANVERIRRMPKPVRFNDPRAAALIAKLGDGPSSAQAPPGPSTELELADKARRDRERLAEAEKKVAGNGGES